MKFDKPAGENPIDQLKVVGRPHDRIDGPLKTTGTARYAYEWHEEAPNAAYGYIVGSAIAKGRLTALDTDAAQKAPGVLAVITASNAGALGKGDKNTARLLGGPTIEHYHQAIALVVAETFEQARAAASLVQAHYRRNKGAYSLADEKQAVNQPPEDTPDKNVGDFDGAFTSAAVKIDATYTTPDQSHMAMEPHASMAVWDGNKLTLWTSNQMIDWCRTDLAKTLKVPVENVRIISPYIGGGFGGKLFLRSDALLAALAARAVKRPVKVMLPAPLFPITQRTAPPPFSTCVSVPTRAGKSPLSHMKAGPETCPAARRKRRYSKANYSTPGRIVIPACGSPRLICRKGTPCVRPAKPPV